ncbi:MAG: response regulator [Acidobacteria bacterium]|jgi:CheY-like chemotaxis protein|nr:response regulator [Acidobacteriota bacterium]
MASAKCEPTPTFHLLELARVLLVDDDPAARLTLRTVLQAGGYGVDTAATAIEAIGMLDSEEYSLVLSDLHMESPDAGLQVISHARMMAYRPATALITSWREQTETLRSPGTMLVEPENVPELLEQVADMIGERASRQLVREMRHRN